MEQRPCLSAKWRHFAGQLFGVRDDWFGRSGIVFHSAEEMVGLAGGLSLLKSEEREYTEKSERGKHWHYYDLILKKS